ncbi:MAG: hypothetical protein E6K81_04295 [Candidatus Eisenbacteria bacterium]|uniref:Uncharacterized protein n=1 Tax=Eiseniibacteriota bacterium TaxID=2212470 RepID=A0A538UCA2_UNCEI|nr:MAG: hypothetical protein E6K81_04295 [Candidatus Eisenbacteria bacterium]
MNGIDDDNDGIVDERRDGGEGIQIVGQSQILAYWAAHDDTAKFTAFYGPIADRPAYRYGSWWTGDEDMDWRPDFDDVGADGVPDTHDAGEGNGIPTEGEPDFDRTDLNESDQIGLTGFKMNRIFSPGGQPTDGILFYTDDQNWPARLYTKFTDPNPAARFDSATVTNYNIGFLFASGPFVLAKGKTERFSLALAYGADLAELRETVHTVQLIYNANYQFAVPPLAPTVTAEAGDGRVRLTWTDGSERAFDPVTNEFDFEGYRVYRSTDPDFLDPKVISNGHGTGPIGNGKPIAQFDLDDDKRGFSKKTIDGVGYWLGDNTGITHTWTDTTVTNGQQYFYAVCAYDFGRASDLDSLAIYPSENSIPVSRTPRGGLILPQNVVAVRPEPRVPGFQAATTTPATHVAGTGTGTADAQVVNTDLVPGGHQFALSFTSVAPDSFRATAYTLRDSTTHHTLFTTGHDFVAGGTGATADGLLPRIFSHPSVTVDLANSGFTPASTTTTRLKAAYQSDVLSSNQRRPGYPDDLRIEFSDLVEDTSIAIPNSSIDTPVPAKFRVFAETPEGDRPLDFGRRRPGFRATPRVRVLLVRGQRRQRDDPRPQSVGVAGEHRGGRLRALGDLHRHRPRLDHPRAGGRPRRHGGGRRLPRGALRGAQPVHRGGELRAAAVRGVGPRGAPDRVPRHPPGQHDPHLHGARGSGPDPAAGRIDPRLRGLGRAHQGRSRPGAGPLPVPGRSPRRRRGHRQVRGDQMSARGVNLGTGVPLLAAVLALALSAAPARAQSKTGTAMGQFLLIEPNARVAGMGNAGVALADGLDGVYYNPAAIAAPGWRGSATTTWPRPSRSAPRAARTRRSPGSTRATSTCAP